MKKLIVILAIVLLPAAAWGWRDRYRVMISFSCYPSFGTGFSETIDISGVSPGVSPSFLAL